MNAWRKPELPAVNTGTALGWGLVGVVGLVGGLFVSAAYSTSTTWMAVITFAVMAAFIGLCIGIKSGTQAFIGSDFVNSYDKRHKRNRLAAKIGTIVGLIGGLYWAHNTSLNWPIAPLTALVGALFFAGFGNSMQHAHEKTKPTAQQLAVPLGKSNVEEWKLRRVQAKLKVGQVLQNANETALQAVTEYHWMKLVMDWIAPGLVIFGSLWATVDFRGYDNFLQFFTTGQYNWAFGAAGIVALGIWVYKNQKRLKAMLLKATAYAVVIGLIWIGFQMPWSQFLLDAFRSGRPGPWLLVCVIGMLWAFWRWAKWFYGFIAATDKRIIEGTAMPFPIPNLRRVLLFPANSADSQETWLGNILDYGHLVLDGAGTLDWFFNNIRFVKNFIVIADSVIVK